MSDRTLVLAPPRPWQATLLLALPLSLLLVASAKAQVPFWPVPMTLQTLAVLVIGGLLGPRVAVAAMAAYLLEGAAGLPVFSGTPAHGIGLAYMTGPTGGYLLGLVLAAAMAGWAGQRFGRRPILLAAGMLAALALNYLPGIAWLATFTGWGRVVALGVAPFIVADLVKVAVATALVLAAARLRPA
jgi:biotin transport system substrate-specific component